MGLSGVVTKRVAGVPLWAYPLPLFYLFWTADIVNDAYPIIGFADDAGLAVLFFLFGRRL